MYKHQQFASTICICQLQVLIIAISRKITSQGNVNNNNNNNKNKLVHINFICNIGVYKLVYANKIW